MFNSVYFDEDEFPFSYNYETRSSSRNLKLSRFNNIRPNTSSVSEPCIGHISSGFGPCAGHISSSSEPCIGRITIDQPVIDNGSQPAPKPSDDNVIVDRKSPAECNPVVITQAECNPVVITPAVCNPVVITPAVCNPVVITPAVCNPVVTRDISNTPDEEPAIRPVKHINEFHLSNDIHGNVLLNIPQVPTGKYTQILVKDVQTADSRSTRTKANPISEYLIGKLRVILTKRPKCLRGLY